MDRILEIRISSWLALFSLVCGLLCFGLIALAALAGGLPPSEPYLPLISAVTFLSIPGIILPWVVLNRPVTSPRQFFSHASLALIVIFAALTSLNRYNILTVETQAPVLGQTEGLAWLKSYGWPSILAVMEVLVWGFNFGTACLCLAPVFVRGRLKKNYFRVGGGLRWIESAINTGANPEQHPAQCVACPGVGARLSQRNDFMDSLV
jgi:hypothetical protein